MELTKDDIGKVLLWVQSTVRTGQLLSINPANVGDQDDEALIAPSSGGRVWVRLSELAPVPDGGPPWVSRVAEHLAAYDRLRAHVRELLDYAMDPRGGVRVDNLEPLLLKLHADLERS